MQFAIIVAGALLIVTAYQNTVGDLGAALKTDAAGYFRWAGAIAIILAIGMIPGMKTPSRWLLALVAVVVVVKNYTAILSGFSNFAKTGAASTGQGTPETSPAAAYAANPKAIPVAAEVTGTSGTSAPGQSLLQLASAVGFSDPASYVTAIESGFGGTLFT